MTRREAYRRGRALFERHRSEWLIEHAGSFAIIDCGKLVGFDPNKRSTGDHVFAFHIVTESEEHERLVKIAHLDPWKCVCEPYLDTDMPADVDVGKRAIKAAYGMAVLRLMQLAAFGGCIWNILWWEWGYMGLGHVLLGWGYTAALGAGVAGTAAIVFMSKNMSFMASIMMFIAIIMALCSPVLLFLSVERAKEQRKLHAARRAQNNSNTNNNE